MYGSFLQSREWEAFQGALGRNTRRVQGVLVIRHDLPLGLNYLYCPRPDAGRWTQDSRFWNEACEIARKEKSIFLKIDPIGSTFSPASSIQHPASSLQPQKTAILNVEKPEDELLAGMHEKTRYNIRLAERKGVEITSRDSRITTRDTEIFWQLLQETAARDGFAVHSRRHYEALLAVRSDDFSNELFFAQYRGSVLAAAMVNFYRPNQTATYLHGASRRHHREVMAPHLLHWRIMQEAKSRGYQHYDFWGIDEARWPGVTRFKRGFGADVVSFPVGVDMVYRPAWYGAYRIRKFLKAFFDGQHNG